LTEDFCGVEPVTLPPIEKETRPPPDIDEDKLRQYEGLGAGLLSSIFLIILLCLIAVFFLIYRHQQRHKGEYLTQEDKGADEADADDAVVHSTTGHHVTKKKEWFI
jgi:contactin associated protein-like 2